MNDHGTADSVRNARREAMIVAALWCTAAAYTIGYCGMFGYGRSAADLTFVFGIPDWVFWGIVVPWITCLVIGCWFAWFYMTDEELGEDAVPPSELASRNEVSRHG